MHFKYYASTCVLDSVKRCVICFIWYGSEDLRNDSKLKKYGNHIHLKAIIWDYLN